MAITLEVEMNFEQVVPIHQIESALDKVLDEMQGKNKIRASLFNLLIYSKENKRESYIQLVTKKIVEKFPCRILLFINRGNDFKEIESKISVIEVEEQKNSEIFCDCIQFDMNEKELNKIPFLTFPHLIPDLPSYFLFSEDPEKFDLYPLHLENFCSRVIFDSETSENLLVFAKTVLKYQVKSGLQIADLNWARTESFRNLFMAQFLHQKTESKLNQLKNITITYNQVRSDFFSHTKIQSIYLAIWISIHLNLKLKNASIDQLIFDNQGKDLKICLAETSSNSVNAGRILSLELDLEEGEHYLFKRKEKNPHVIIIYPTKKDFCEIPSEFLLDGEESGASLVGEIFHHSASNVFLKVLNYISHQQTEDFCS